MGRRHAGLFFLSFIAEDAAPFDPKDVISLQSSGEFASMDGARV
jgi:hypothetical protein